MFNRSEREKQASSWTVFIVMIITLFARFFGLLREILIAGYYGTSVYTDAYIIANNIPTVLFDTLGQALLTSFIPMYLRVRQEESEARANRFTIHLISYLMIICAFIIALGEIFTKQVVYVFASGFQGEALRITVTFSRILLPSLFAMTLLNLFTGYLQIYQKFILSTVVTVIGNLSIIIALVIANASNNVYIFVWGSLIGLIAQVLFLMPSIIRLGLLKNKTKLFEPDKYVRLLIPILIPVFIGSAINEINSIIDKTMVSGLEMGAVSTLNYAYKIISLVISVIVTPIITIMYQRISSLAANGDVNNYRKSVHRCLNIIFAVIIPTVIVVVFFREPIIRILFERGNFDSSSTMKTSKALACYAFGLPAMAVQQVLIRVFYSKQNTVAPMISGVICAIVNIGLDYVLINKCGFIGAALATSLVAIISCVVLAIMHHSKGWVSLRLLGISMVKNGIAGGGMAIVLGIILNMGLERMCFSSKYFIGAILGVIISGIVYLLMQLLVKNKEVLDEVRNFIKKGR